MMLCLGGNFVNDNSVSMIINVIIGTKELHIYSVHKLFFSVKNNLSQEGLVKVALYAFGELGDLLTTNSVIGPEDEIISIREADLMNLIKEILHKKYEGSSLKEFLLNALVKLSVRLSENNLEGIKSMLENENSSYFTEVQQRANEYLFIIQPKLKELKAQILEGIPLAKIIKEFDIKK
jgi:AP-1 complex subunit gamma-1